MFAPHFRAKLCELLAFGAELSFLYGRRRGGWVTASNPLSTGHHLYSESGVIDAKEIVFAPRHRHHVKDLLRKHTRILDVAPKRCLKR